MEAIDKEKNWYELWEEYAKGVNNGINRVLEALTYPSCWTCKYAIIFEDRSVGIWPYVDDCSNPKFNQEFLEELFENANEEDELADKCGGWTLDPSTLQERF